MNHGKLANDSVALDATQRARATGRTVFSLWLSWRTISLAACLGFALATIPARAATLHDGSGDPAWVIVDDYGVSHCYAWSPRALYYAAGYSHAKDRLWQAEMFRRTATGTMAEWFGETQLQSDLTMRQIVGSTERRAEEFARSPQEVQTIIQAFVDGINAWIAEASAAGELPAEYAAYGVSPRPWTVDDTVATTMMMMLTYNYGSNELDNAQIMADLAARLGGEEASRVFADVRWLDDPSAPVTVPSVDSSSPSRAYIHLPANLQQHARAANQISRENGLHKSAFSYGLVISPHLSATGHAMLMGGPQMFWNVPQTTYEIGLYGGGVYVTGNLVAGTPLVVVGVGSSFAWTITAAGLDQNDIFMEILNPDNPGQYLFNGVWRDHNCRDEVLAVAGQPEPVVQRFCESVHGPVLTSVDGKAYALQNVLRGREMDSMAGFIGMAKARSMDEFAAALAEMGFGMNTLYADSSGNIAYWHAGKLPIRAAGADPWFPTLGDGSLEWQGVMPFSDQPHTLNPDQGWLASWNNKPAAGWKSTTNDVPFSWGPVNRVQTLMNAVQSQPPHSVTMQTLEEIVRTAAMTTDTPSGSFYSVYVSSGILERMLAQVDSSADPRLGPVIDLLRGWDRLQVDENGDGHYDSPAVIIFNAWFKDLTDTVFAEKLGSRLMEDRVLLGNLVMRLVQGEEAALPLMADYLYGQTVTQVLTDSLVATIDDLSIQFGSSNPADWLPDIATIHWIPSGIGTVPDTIWMNRGTENTIVDLGLAPWDMSAENVVPPGQSGDYRSPHFSDQLGLYTSWKYKTMRTNILQLYEHIESVKLLMVP